MNKIIFILPNNSEKNVEFEEGDSILETAEKNGVKIKSGCEGNSICGLCHVLIENQQEKLPPISEDEDDALDRVQGLTQNSRLACQIKLNASLNGLRVQLP